MRLIPREESFFEMFVALILKIEEGGNLFAEMLKRFETAEPKLQGSRRSNMKPI